MGLRGDIAKLEHLAARAALQPLQLPEMLAQVSRMIGAEMSTVELFDTGSGELLSIVTDRPDIMSETGQAFEKHYAVLNPRLPHVLGAAQGAFITDDVIGSDAELMRLEFYADFLAPSDMRYFAASKIVENSRHSGLVSAQIAPRYGRPGSERGKIWRALIPFVGNAVALNAKIMGQPLIREFADLIDWLAAPIAILSASGRLLFANRSMQHLLAAGTIVTMEHGELTAVANSWNRPLATVMRKLRSGVLTASAPVGHRSHSGAVWRGVRLMPTQADAFGSHGGASICLLLDLPLSVREAPLAAIEKDLGLSRREAEVGLLLAEGMSVDEVAAALGRSRNTIRTHVSALRDKLGVNSSIAAAAIIRRFCVPILRADAADGPAET